MNLKNMSTRIRRSGGLRLIVLLVVMVALVALYFSQSHKGKSVKSRRHHHRLTGMEKFKQMRQRHIGLLGEADPVLGSRGNRSRVLFEGSPSNASQARGVEDQPLNRISKRSAASGSSINIVIVLTNVQGSREDGALRFFASILQNTVAKLCFHVVADQSGRRVVDKSIMQHTHASAKFYDSKVLANDLSGYVDSLRTSLSTGKDNYFNDPVFFIAPVLYKVLPADVQRVIFLDTDLKFMADVAGLYAEFENFKPGQCLGLAYENQPVYKHLMANYIRSNPNSWIAKPHPDGIIGYNSGVMLQDLAAIRQDQAYQSLVTGASIANLSAQYQFHGHLGGQDLFTLISLENRQLVHLLPCQWNRQLCRFWRTGYREIFHKYYDCPPPIKVYHANCGSSIPNS